MMTKTANGNTILVQLTDLHIREPGRLAYGRIVQVGRGEDLYRAPAHPFVAEFLGRVNRLAREADAIAQGVVRLGGSNVPCPSAWLSHATLLVRPEDIEVNTPQPGWGAATVERRTFLGDRVQLHLRTADIRFDLPGSIIEQPSPGGE